MGSIPSGSPRTTATSSAFNPVSSIIVVVGEMIDEPFGAESVTFAKISPEEASTVVSSVRTVKLYPSLPVKEKKPSSSVLIKGSNSLTTPS